MYGDGAIYERVNGNGHPVLTRDGATNDGAINERDRFSTGALSYERKVKIISNMFWGVSR